MENINKEDPHYNCRMDTINKIIELHPQLLLDKNNIISTVFNCYQKPNKYILTKIKVGEEYLYKDPTGMLFDSNMKFKGLILDSKYYLEDEINKPDVNINFAQLDSLMNSKK